MTSLPQFPPIPQSQFDFFRAVTEKAFSSAERVIALNLNTSRASVERSSNVIKQLLQTNDPRDLMSLTSQSQQELQSLLAYSRELLSIVADVGLKLPAQTAALPAPVATQPVAVRPAPQAVAPQPAAPKANAPQANAPQANDSMDDAIAEQVAKASKAPVVATVAEPAAEPVAEEKPLAKALSKVAPKPAGAEHPLAAPVANQREIELPSVKPVEAAPPPVQVAGTPEIEVRQAETARNRGARKK